MNINILKIRQALDLDIKIMLTKQRIWQFYHKNRGNVCISFSGGKDSTVLLDLVRQDFPDIPAVFVDTGLEYPEIREFVKTVDNVEIVKPEINFRKVLDKYGYPVVSKEVSQKIYDIRNTKSEKLRNKRLYGDDKGNGKLPEKWKFLIDAPFKISNKCCDAMKKRPFKQVMKNYTGVYIGTMAEESRLRTTSYLKTGCINYKGGHATPLSFWNEKDIWVYIKKYNLSYSRIYDMGYKRTGCMFCMYGIQFETHPNRFEIMENTHPKQYEYCMNNLGIKKILNYLNKRNSNNVELF